MNSVITHSNHSITRTGRSLRAAKSGSSRWAPSRTCSIFRSFGRAMQPEFTLPSARSGQAVISAFLLLSFLYSHTHIYIYIYIYIHTYIHTYIHIYINTPLSIHLLSHTHTHTHTHVHTYR